MAEQKTFSQSQVNQIFQHIPSRTIRFWVEGCLIECPGATEDRRGKHRLYSLASLYQLAIVERLTSFISLERIKLLMEKHFQGKDEDTGESITLSRMKHRLIIAETKIGRHGGNVQKIGFSDTSIPITFENMETKLEINLPIVAQRVEWLIKDAGL
jgi:DNA-binding transcriptional MerR regulator